MISIDDLPEMVADLRDGDLRVEDLYWLCVDLMESYPVEDILERLPANVKLEVANRLRRDFDNTTPSDAFVWFHAADHELPAKAALVERVRAWLNDSRNG